MTSSVKIEAHCSPDKEVIVQIDGGSTGETLRLQNGESTTQYIHDSKTISAREALMEVDSAAATD